MGLGLGLALGLGLGLGLGERGCLVARGVAEHVLVEQRRLVRVGVRARARAS